MLTYFRPPWLVVRQMELLQNRALDSRLNPQHSGQGGSGPIGRRELGCRRKAAVPWLKSAAVRYRARNDYPMLPKEANEAN